MPTLDEVGARITWGDEPRRVSHESTYHPSTGRSELNLYVTMADRECSEYPDRRINGDLALASRRGWPKVGVDVSVEEALLPIVTAMIVNDLHEMAEYLRYDGERVFDPHPGDGPKSEGPLWDMLGKVASVTAKSMLQSHPRNERIKT